MLLAKMFNAYICECESTLAQQTHRYEYENEIAIEIENISMSEVRYAMTISKRTLVTMEHRCRTGLLYNSSVPVSPALDH